MVLFDKIMIGEKTLLHIRTIKREKIYITSQLKKKIFFNILLYLARNYVQYLTYLKTNFMRMTLPQQLIFHFPGSCIAQPNTCPRMISLIMQGSKTRSVTKTR